jgi:hypothetical protein
MGELLRPGDRGYDDARQGYNLLHDLHPGLIVRPADGGDVARALELAADESRLHETYPDGTYQRLAEVKRRYDPGNRFRRNLNIRPVETEER